MSPPLGRPPPRRSPLRKLCPPRFSSSSQNSPLKLYFLKAGSCAEGDLGKALSLAEVVWTLVWDISDVGVRGEDGSSVPGGRAGSSLCPVSPAGLESLPGLDLGNWASAANDQSLPHSSELRPARGSAGSHQTPRRLETSQARPPPPHVQARSAGYPLTCDSMFAVTSVWTSRG